MVITTTQVLKMKEQELKLLLKNIMIQIADGCQTKPDVIIGRSDNLFICVINTNQTDYLSLHYIREYLIKIGFAVNNIQIFSTGRKDEFSIRVMAEYIGGTIE